MYSVMELYARTPVGDMDVFQLVHACGGAEAACAPMWSCTSRKNCHPPSYRTTRAPHGVLLRAEGALAGCGTWVAEMGKPDIRKATLLPHMHKAARMRAVAPIQCGSRTRVKGRKRACMSVMVLMSGISVLVRSRGCAAGFCWVYIGSGYRSTGLGAARTGRRQ